MDGAGGRALRHTGPAPSRTPRHLYIGRVHKNFHVEVVPLLSTRNRLAEAAAWFRNLREEHPEAVPPSGNWSAR